MLTSELSLFNVTGDGLELDDDDDDDDDEAFFGGGVFSFLACLRAPSAGSGLGRFAEDVDLAGCATAIRF